jgi:hypothetical protein
MGAADTNGATNFYIEDCDFHACGIADFDSAARVVHAETVFSAIKRKLSPKAPGRSLATQRKQALLLGLAYNIYKLWPLPFRTPINGCAFQ